MSRSAHPRLIRPGQVARPSFVSPIQSQAWVGGFKVHVQSFPNMLIRNDLLNLNSLGKLNCRRFNEAANWVES
jgi:hypothetical protein